MSAVSSQIDATIKIVTPENIAFHYRVAGPFRRFPAYLLDLVIRWAILFVLFVVCGMLSVAIGEMSLAILLVGYFVLSWFYGGLFETFMNGQTPGKRMLGIRVLTTDGRPIKAHQAILRNILRMADMFPIISGEVIGLPPIPLIPTFLVGLLSMTLNRRYRRLGDLVCNTMVVIEERPWLGGVVKFNDPRTYQLASHLPTDLRVSRSMARAIAHYAERRRYFSAPRRREVAEYLAEPLLKRFGLPSNTSYDLLLCSMYYRLFVADRSDDETHAARAEAAMGRRRYHPFGRIPPQSPFDRT
jgi:uncharacterized RDD family membrane protein YckC